MMINANMDVLIGKTKSIPNWNALVGNLNVSGPSAIWLFLYEETSFLN
jgi:hypothetical protein